MDETHDFEALVRRHQGVVCAVAYSLLRDRARSEEVAQEAFLIAWQKLPSLASPPAMPAWLCGIARNLAANAARRKDTAMATTDTAALADTETPLDNLLDREASELAHRALAELDTRDREVVTLYYRNEESIADVASALGITAAAARQRLHRGRERLKSALVAVEATLRRTRPTPAFTAACVAGLAVGAAGKASADTAATVAVGAAKSTTPVWFGLLGIAAIAVVTVGAARALADDGSPATTSTPIVRRIDATTRAVQHDRIVRATASLHPQLAAATAPVSTPSTPAVGAGHRSEHDVAGAHDHAAAERVFDFAGDVLAKSHDEPPLKYPHVLNKASMRHAIRDIQPLLLECYTAAAQQHPHQRGTIGIILRLVGDTEGTLVDSVEVDGDVPLAHDADLAECMRETAMTIELPAMPAPATWDVHYPFAVD